MVINWRDTVYLLEFSESWISSSVLPLVSGTSLATNSIVAKLAAENMKNVPVGTQQH
jgi:Iap family predicted aminopeptidase